MALFKTPKKRNKVNINDFFILRTNSKRIHPKLLYPHKNILKLDHCWGRVWTIWLQSRLASLLKIAPEPSLKKKKT